MGGKGKKREGMKGKDSSSGFRSPRWRNGGRRIKVVYITRKESADVSHLEPYVTPFIFLGSGTLVMEMFGWVGWLVGWLWMEGLEQSRAETGIYVDGGFGR